MARSERMLSVLTIAGSDSGGGAGIQADLKTFAAHGLHGLCAITASTAQNTRAVTDIHALPIAHIEAQLDALFDDFDIGAVKIGMLGTRRIVRAVARALARRGPLRLVVDPVMVASSGATLLDQDAICTLRDELLPLATIATPNLPEASLLLGKRITRVAQMDESARQLRAYGINSVLLKGGHLARGAMIDVLATSDGLLRFEHPRLAASGHGTGCTLASALAAQLARGVAIETAAHRATDYVHGALANGYRPGRGKVEVLNHFWHVQCAVDVPQFPFR
jgi:hydroxymethylpyrimidine/phosphomethylpyrimidine kinase